MIAAAAIAIGAGPATVVAGEAEEMEGGSSQKLTVEGYGELHFNIPELPETGNPAPVQGNPAASDFHRMALGFSYQYTDRIVLHAELDFEHAAQDIELEFAYIDFMVNPWLTVRGGAILLPIGSLNEFHEPLFFYSVERPSVQTVLIPTTWGGAAGGIGGEWQGVRYRMYLTSGLDASGFTAAGGIQKGTRQLDQAPSGGLAYVGRLEYVGFPGIVAGASAFIQPQANQRERDPGPGLTLNANPGVRLFEGDIRIRKAGFDLQGTVVQTRIKGAATLSADLSEHIGTIEFGWYVEGAYHLFNLLAPESAQDGVVFVRYEQFDTQARMPAGLIADPANNHDVITVGVSYMPISRIAIKLDHESWTDGLSDHGSRTNLGLAYMF
jgi:hypothetical protein